MKSNLIFLLLPLLLFFSCTKKEETKVKPALKFSAASITLDDVKEGEISLVKSVVVSGAGLTKDVQLSTSNQFEISTNSSTFASKITLTAKDLASEKTIFVRFNALTATPARVQSELVFSSEEITPDEKINLLVTVLEVPKPTIIFTPATDITGFLVEENGVSEAKTVEISGQLLAGAVSVKASEMFMISNNGTNFYSSLSFSSNELNTGSRKIFVQFKPSSGFSGEKVGTITAEGAGAKPQVLNLKATAIATETFNYITFNRERLGFGAGLSQSSTKKFTLHSDVTKVSKVYMYVRLNCPTGGCNAWDVFANISVKAPNSDEYYEIGRYITPYGIDNSKLSGGFRIDVTDFKSLLQGEVELKSFIEVWGSDGWLLSVDFDFIEGMPDYPYSAISRVMQYNRNSIEGVPYGENISAYDLTKTFEIPSNAEKTYMRTIITGWGHATPNDPDGRPCAEWCFRTHKVNIDGKETFQHALKPIGCAKNKVSPQAGNWQPDRAGWCPGMEVPLRIDEFSSSMSGKTLSYEYVFEPWVNNNGGGRAFYAISSFVVVKSKTPISAPRVTE